MAWSTFTRHQRSSTMLPSLWDPRPSIIRRFSTFRLVTLSIHLSLIFIQLWNKTSTTDAVCDQSTPHIIPSPPRDSSRPNPSPEWNPKDPLDDIYNSTLGFQKIFAIGLPERVDKKDSLEMSASILGIDLEWFDGVKPSDIPEKAYPAGWDMDRGRPDEIGCWRAHINVMRYIVANKISSALILEDDADFDIAAKELMKEFARGARALQGTNSTPHSPYGDDWDLLWVGQLGVNALDESRVYVIPNDATVRPVAHEETVFRPQLAERPEYQQSRLVFSPMSSTGTAATAVNYKTAQKMLAILSMGPNNEPIDHNYRLLCNGEYEDVDFRCIAPYPGIFNFWRKEGPGSRDSDIEETESDWHGATSNELLFSTALNARRYLKGEKTAKAQWEDAPQQEIPWDYKPPRGSLVTFEDGDKGDEGEEWQRT